MALPATMDAAKATEALTFMVSPFLDPGPRPLPGGESGYR